MDNDSATSSLSSLGINLDSDKKQNTKPSTTTMHNDMIANDIKIKQAEEPTSALSDISRNNSVSSISSKSSNKSTSNRRKSSRRNSPKLHDNIHNSPLKPVDVKFKKIELLKKLLDLKEKGFKLTKTYDFNSSLEEMEYEYEVLKRYADKRNGLKIARNLLINSVSVLEFMNNTYNPIDFQLEGWAEHTQVEIDNYDNVLEELWEKYKMTGRRFSPEIRLIFMLTASAAAYHFTKSHTKNSSFEQAVKNNPSMLASLFAGNKPPPSKYVTPQELNLRRQQEVNQQEVKQQTEPVVKPPIDNKFTNNYQNVESADKVELDLSAPTDIDSILQKNTEPNNATKEVLNRLQESTNNERIISETNVKPKRKRGRPKKNSNV